MTRHGRRAAGLMLLIATAGFARADGFRPAGAPVPATQEIEVLDPGVDPTGKPAVLLRPGPAGGQVVDVPPAVLVHRFYYTGDRTFQGPMLPGGPMIVAVNHPATLERVYVPVTMPPGAPKVTYTGHAIRYDYGPQSVTLRFGVCGKPTVHYSQCSQLGEKTRQTVVGACDTTKDLYRRTGIRDGYQQLCDETKKLLGATADALGSARQTVANPVVMGFQSLTSAVQPAEAAGAKRAATATENATRRLDAEPFVPRVP